MATHSKTKALHNQSGGNHTCFSPGLREQAGPPTSPTHLSFSLMLPSYFPSPFPPYRSLASPPTAPTVYSLIVRDLLFVLLFVMTVTVYVLRAASCELRRPQNRCSGIALSCIPGTSVYEPHPLVFPFDRKYSEERVIPVLDGFERVLTIRWGCALLQKRARLVLTNQFETFDTLRVMVNDQSRNM